MNETIPKRAFFINPVWSNDQFFDIAALLEPFSQILEEKNQFYPHGY